MSELYAKDSKQLAEMFLRHPDTGCMMFFSSGVSMEDDGKAYSFTVSSADGGKQLKHTIITEEVCP
jgi:hypothetical protein